MTKFLELRSRRVQSIGAGRSAASWGGVRGEPTPPEITDAGSAINRAAILEKTGSSRRASGNRAYDDDEGALAEG